jgi:hypothetical protein
VILDPLLSVPDSEIRVFYDGITLVSGDFSNSSSPEFDDNFTQSGLWAGKPINNIIRNASVETSWPRLRPKVDSAIQRFTPLKPSWMLNSILDWENSKWYYQEASSNLLRTFWGKFGWGHVPIIGRKPYRVPGLITLLGVACGVWWAIRRLTTSSFELPVFLGITLLLVWGAALLRGMSSIEFSIIFLFIPAARYAYPAIVPTVMLLNAGWLALAEQLENRLRIPKFALLFLYLFFFIGLDIISLISIYRFYYSAG